jgi:hypothetical protein
MTQHRRSRTVIPIQDASSPWHELTLADLLSDPIVEAVMAADSVDRSKLRRMLDGVARTLGTDGQSRPRRDDRRTTHPIAACCGA